jgi:hypothetical protein
MLELKGASVAEMRGGERKEMYCHVGVPTGGMISVNCYTRESLWCVGIWLT